MGLGFLNPNVPAKTDNMLQLLYAVRKQRGQVTELVGGAQWSVISTRKQSVEQPFASQNTQQKGPKDKSIEAKQKMGESRSKKLSYVIFVWSLNTAQACI